MIIHDTKKEDGILMRKSQTLSWFVVDQTFLLFLDAACLAETVVRDTSTHRLFLVG